LDLSSLYHKFIRWIKRKQRDLLSYIPIQKPKGIKRKKSSSKRKYKDDVEVYRNVHHIPFYKKFKQILAAVLLLFNLIFSQFLLGTSSAGQIMFLIFLANSFILADYLWKMRKKPDE
jgi:hypothetical protein